MPELPPDDETPAPAPRTAPRTALVCEFCECRLTPTGDVLRLSEKAKGIRDNDGALEKLNKRIAELEAQLADARTRAAVAKDTALTLD